MSAGKTTELPTPPEVSRACSPSLCYSLQLTADSLACSVIGTDEDQFFEICLGSRIPLSVADLESTFQWYSFGQILRLIAKCESLDKLSAICATIGGDSQEREVIGGGEVHRLQFVSISSLIQVEQMYMNGKIRSNICTQL
jgi:hypothetical protein